jgi:translocation and assembly module TamA
MQEFTGNYRLPYFLRNDQDFIARGGLLRQDTDAYRLDSGAFSAGIERRLSSFWSVVIQGSAEGGSSKTPEQRKREYLMFGLPLGLSYDNTGNLLNAVEGQRLFLSLAPYQGRYEGDFSALRSRLDVHNFIPLKGEDDLVLAVRGTAGSVQGADSKKIPPSIRFYSGGGGSVRGYAFQSLGPRSSKKRPLGGDSLAELSAETRWKLTPEWGLTAFVDGGSVYGNAFPDFSQPMRWGAGFGVRYYTVIGPVRFDLATPLTPRSDDAPIQFYISIGQSF